MLHSSDIRQLAEAWNALDLDDQVAKILDTANGRLRQISTDYTEYRAQASDGRSIMRRIADGELSIGDAVIAHQSIKTGRDTAVTLADGARRFAAQDAVTALRKMLDVIGRSVEECEARNVADAHAAGVVIGDIATPADAVKAGAKAAAAWAKLDELRETEKVIGSVVRYLRQSGVMPADIVFGFPASADDDQAVARGRLWLDQAGFFIAYIADWHAPVTTIKVEPVRRFADKVLHGPGPRRFIDTTKPKAAKVPVPAAAGGGPAAA